MARRLYGSLQNRLMENCVGTAPEVGLGCTVCLHSDRHAYTIMKVDKSGKKFWISQDKVTMKPNGGLGTAGQQEYEYETVTRAPEHCEEVRLCKDGRWRVAYPVWRDDNKHPDGGKWGKSTQGGSGVMIGVRDEYYDPHF